MWPESGGDSPGLAASRGKNNSSVACMFLGYWLLIGPMSCIKGHLKCESHQFSSSESFPSIPHLLRCQLHLLSSPSWVISPCCYPPSISRSSLLNHSNTSWDTHSLNFIQSSARAGRASLQSVLCGGACCRPVASGALWILQGIIFISWSRESDRLPELLWW